MRARLFVSTFSVFTLVAAPTLARAAPHYSLGQAGTFGSAGGWTANANGITIDSTNDLYAVPFTAYEIIDIDRIWQGYVGLEANTSVEVGIMADNGSGRPTGTFLSGLSGTFTTTTAPGGVAVIDANFPTGTNVSIVSGNTYHVVTRATSFDTAGDNFIIRVGGAEIIRPYDRGVDPVINRVSRSFNGSSTWSDITANAFFVFGNDGTVIGGPGQPYTTTAGNQFTSSTTSPRGQQFTITDKEIPEDTYARIDSITIAANNNGSTSNLNLQLREAGPGGAILANTVFPLALAGTTQTLTWDKPAYLKEGVSYVLTSTVATGSYRFSGLTGAGGLGDATWGGKTTAFAVAGNATWSTYSADASRPDTDIAFSMSGFVVSYPEPSAALAVLSLAGAAMLRRCRRSS